MTDWPVVNLDAVDRLRVLATATSAMFVERSIDAGFANVWAVVDDLEHELPQLLPDVRSIQVTQRSNGLLEGRARGYGGMRARFDIVLEPGWCVMQSRFLLGAMAAVPDGDNTRFAFLGAFRFPGHRIVSPLLRPISRRYGNLMLARLSDRLRG